MANRPNALAWVSTHQTQLIWQMGLARASGFKRARISTGHEVSPRQVARIQMHLTNPETDDFETGEVP